MDTNPFITFEVEPKNLYEPRYKYNVDSFQINQKIT